MLILQDGSVQYAHKCVLAAGSEYFENVIQNYRQPLLELELDIMPTEVAKVLIEYFYSGEIQILFESSTAEGAQAENSGVIKSPNVKLELPSLPTENSADFYHPVTTVDPGSDTEQTNITSHFSNASKLSSGMHETKLGNFNPSKCIQKFSELDLLKAVEIFELKHISISEIQDFYENVIYKLIPPSPAAGQTHPKDSNLNDAPKTSNANSNSDSGANQSSEDSNKNLFHTCSGVEFNENEMNKENSNPTKIELPHSVDLNAEYLFQELRKLFKIFHTYFSRIFFRRFY